ncbi:MAG: TetR/AcrR family transcriptional regulator [Erysipelotrichaceae bacterium]|nr:TetR/AcrR family transcriptional regulator [Erysipelotrichaceae bacterium]
MKRSESKYFNTAVLMDQALLDLLEKKELQYISIKEICDKAGVNRSTFYLHYETINDLLNETVAYSFKELFTFYEETPEGFLGKMDNENLDELMLINNEYLLPYLRFIREKKFIFKAVFSSPAAMSADDSYAGLKKHILKPIMVRFGVPEDDQEYKIDFYIQGMMAVIRKWIKNDCKEDMDMIARIIIECVHADGNGSKIYKYET